ncbi:hypothetical protein DVH07_02215 [Hafnia paralvei]|uniref:DNA-binding protein n=2 Tax=Hafniaceae TaxID=1903412 RepID=UPI000DF3060E|nr:DNA-binding protein [Hafnia paralvei]NUN43353.1 hypothetical protein [Hafnia paralvei]RDA71778.1 hypothetical protein DU449_02455 [Hafnia paralvei]RDA72525.1 hypothetical protein DVH09_02315 [Hafnia paralvei]RDA72747.1 hypothetical protein DVH08_03155 [Hafnia paralvei]RDA81314.1 hypothetical protein DVH10_02245 [Hafnia paralvei]
MELEWFTAKQLTEIAHLPTTPQGLHLHARKLAWIRRKRDGKTIEYHIDSFPNEVKQALRGRQVTEFRYQRRSCDGELATKMWEEICVEMSLLLRQRLVELALREGVDALFFRLVSSLR